MEFYARTFDRLTTGELHDAYALRAAVFVVEQQCAYQDPDAKDTSATHIFGYRNEQLVAYCRIIPPGIAYKEPAIGRVVVTKDSRGTGLGKSLMRFALRQIVETYGTTAVVISAQCYLEKFYFDLGFVSEGEQYLEDDIPHIRMRIDFKAASSRG